MNYNVNKGEQMNLKINNITDNKFQTKNIQTQQSTSGVKMKSAIDCDTVSFGCLPKVPKLIHDIAPETKMELDKVLNILKNRTKIITTTSTEMIYKLSMENPTEATLIITDLKGKPQHHITFYDGKAMQVLSSDPNHPGVASGKLLGDVANTMVHGYLKDFLSKTQPEAAKITPKL